MTTYAKPSVGPAWAETASNPADIITMTSSDVSAGWPLSGTPPSRQRFNYLLNWCTNAVRYFMQRGIVDYDAAETYQLNALVIGDDGNTYKSLQNANTNHAPSGNPTWWTPWGLTIAQVDAATLTQANISTGDTSTKVANTNFVAAAISQLAATVATNIAALQAWTTAQLATLAAEISSAITTVESYVTLGFSVSLGTSGYIKFPTWASGFTLQWKHGTALSGSQNGTDTTTALPTAFSNACLFAMVSGLASGTDMGESPCFSTRGWTSNSVTYYYQRNADHGGMTVTPLIFAIGY
jgi:hypothetical protein